ncbi:hypothetical protein RIF29_40428 [Crotalaria pallida]|uniref:Seipin-2-like n=1 Tax=Crotalaria pallida TaxID=3830 RepID=A0AAN9HQN8_CROPI
MDPPPSNHDDDDDGVFSDAIDHCTTLSFNPTANDSPEPSPSASTLSDPQPVSSDPKNSQTHPSSPVTTTIRSRKIRRVSLAEESLDSSFDSTVNSESDLINGAKTSFRNHKNLQISKEDENLAQKRVLKDDVASNLTEKSDLKDEVTSNLTEKRDLKDDAASNLVEIPDSKNIADSNFADKHGLKDNAALNLAEKRDSKDDAASNLVTKHNSKDNAASNFGEKRNLNYNAASDLTEKHDLKDHTASNLDEKCSPDDDAASNLVEERDLKDNAALNLTENNEGSSSTVTTAANDDAAGDSTDSASQLGDSSLSPLELIASFVIKATEFQIKLFIMFVTYPILFIFRCCVFFIDPSGTMRKGLAFLVGIFGRVWGVMFWCISPFVDRLFKESDTIWSVAFRCGWGLLWSIYVCSILFGLFVSSFVFSGFLMKFLVEKPIQIRQVLNFDYTKHSPVAYMPIISCAGVVDAAKDSKNEIQVSKFVGERVIPSKHKVQVGVSLKVPESGYNRNLGIFQARVDFLLSNGKTIASSSQPCMLKFKSEPIRLFMTFLKIAPLVAGYVSETQNLNVKMRGFVEGDVPTSCLRVTLEQRAEYQLGAGIPEIYDASLVIESELPFFKRIIWLWKLSIYIWIAMMAFVMELLSVLMCCRPIIFPRIRQRAGYARGSAN